MKVIKAQLYINKKVNEEKCKLICNKIDKRIKGLPINYNSYQANEVMVFNVYIQANTFKDCEYFYQMMKRAIKDCSYEAVHQIAKIKAEKPEKVIKIKPER